MADEPKKPDDGNRDAKGRFGPGNPGGTGRRRIDPAVQEMLLAAAPKAAKALIEALDANRALVVAEQIAYVPDHDMRVKAANALLDRVYGKPSQTITDEDGGPMRLGLVILPSET